MDKLALWNAHPTWEKAEKEWNEGAAVAAKQVPLKGLKTLPSIPGITAETAKNLRWKTLKYMLKHDADKSFVKGFLRHPFRYGLTLIRSWTQKKPYTKRDGDFFFYGLHSDTAFKKELEKEDSLLVIGFSYCHKPLECPSGRFTKECIHDPNHPVCRQCFIGKAVNTLPSKRVIPLFIITLHHIGEEMFALKHNNPNHTLLFLITACEMTLEMGGDLGNMLGLKGIGVRLDGRICNTMRAFELSEKGVKPGLTVVLPQTEKRILEILHHCRLNTGRQS